jgi:hypothetical protein
MVFWFFSNILEVICIVMAPLPDVITAGESIITVFHMLGHFFIHKSRGIWKLQLPIFAKPADPTLLLCG